MSMPDVFYCYGCKKVKYEAGNCDCGTTLTRLPVSHDGTVEHDEPTKNHHEARIRYIEKLKALGIGKTYRIPPHKP